MTDAPERIWIDAAGGHWSPVAGGTPEIEYIRADLTVPLPPPKTQDVIAWDRLLDRLPGWIEWVVRDVHGAVFGYDKEPNLCGAEWAIDGRWDRVRISDYPGIVVQIGTCDWTESKQRRPRG